MLQVYNADQPAKPVAYIEMNGSVVLSGDGIRALLDALGACSAGRAIVIQYPGIARLVRASDTLGRAVSRDLTSPIGVEHE